MIDRIELSSGQKTLVNEIVGNLRKQPYRDVRAQSLAERWVSDALLLSPDDKNRIGVLWLEHVLGADMNIIRGFLDGYLSAWNEVGKLQSGIKPKDIAGFWSGVSEINPRLTSDNIIFLVDEDSGGRGAWDMINTFDFIGMRDLGSYSKIIRALVDNALDFK